MSGVATGAVRILRLAAGGDGVGRLEDGRTVFVPRTAPGDLVELAGVREHQRFARARLGTLLEASPLRAEPPCPHYTTDECGGCQLQHLTNSAQLDARRQFVGDAMRRIAKREIADPEILPATTVYGYRTKLTLAVADGGRRIGLHPYSHPDRVFDLRRCHITRDELMMLWSAVRLCRDLLPPKLEHVVLRLDREGGCHLVLRTSSTEAWAGGRSLEQALRRHGQVATIWWQPEGGAARAVAGAKEAFPVSAFEQVHRAMGDTARDFALASLGDVAGLHVWDLYAGIGETTARLAAAGASVESVEAERRAVEVAELQGPPARRHLGKVEDILAELRRPDVVITNPPRTGMDARVTTALERRAPRRIVYISCDPATLARDLVRLPSYQLAAVRAFDLFPQTAHVETVVMLDRL